MLLVHSLILVVGCFFSTFVPLFWPLMITYIGSLLFQGVDPLFLSIVSCASAVVGTTTLWYFDSSVQRFLQWCGFKISALLEKYSLTKPSLPTWTTRLHLSERSQSFAALLLTAYWLTSPLPDMVVIRIVRKKITFPVFLVLVVVAKALAYVPYIYGIELGIDYFF